MELLDQEGETVTVSMTTAQLMGLYCLSKRKQALGHLLGGGIRITDIETRGKLRKKTIKQDEHYKIDVGQRGDHEAIRVSGLHGKNLLPH